MSTERQKIAALFDSLWKAAVRVFPETRKKLEASRTQGVYVILDPDDTVVHAGRTPRAKGGLHQRLYDHLYGRSSVVQEYRRGNAVSLRGSFKFGCLEVGEPRKRALLEAYPTAWLTPAHIGLGQAVLPIPEHWGGKS